MVASTVHLHLAHVRSANECGIYRHWSHVCLDMVYSMCDLERDKLQRYCDMDGKRLQEVIPKKFCK